MKWNTLLPLFGLILILLISPIIGQNTVQFASTTNNISIDDYSNEENGRNFLQTTNAEIFSMFHLMRESSFHKSTGIFDAFVYILALRAMIDRLVRISEEARHYVKYIKTDDEQLKRQLKLLSALGINSQNNNFLGDFISIKIQTDNDFKQKEICSYKDQTNCNLNVVDVNKIVKENYDDVNELLHYWKEVRQVDGPRYKESFKIFHEMLMNATVISEFKSPLDLVLLIYEDTNILNDLDKAMEEIKPFYTNLHAYVRGKLREKFGKDVVSSTGSIPHHLIEKLLVSDIIREEPFDGPIRKSEDELNENYQDASKLVRLSDEFFESMGFESLPSSFWFKYCQEKENTTENDSNDCESEVFDSTNETGLQYCRHSTYGNYLQLHSDMAKLYYANEKRNLPYSLADSYKFEYAIGNAVILAASTLDHLNRVGIFNDYMFSEKGKLFRQSITTMFPLHINYVYNKLITEILTGKVENDDINKRYWELMEKYAGIKTLIPRTSEDFDLPQEFLKDLLDDKLFIKTINVILGYQFYKELCLISREYIVRDDLETPLDICDFSRSTEAGDVLRRMMSLGGTKPWKETLREVIKDEPILNGGAILKYYKSLNELIQKENEKNGFAIGWNN